MLNIIVKLLWHLVNWQLYSQEIKTSIGILQIMSREVLGIILEILIIGQEIVDGVMTQVTTTLMDGEITVAIMEEITEGIMVGENHKIMDGVNKITMAGEDKGKEGRTITDGVDNKIMDGVEEEDSKKNLITITDGVIIIMGGEIQWVQDQITMDGAEDLMTTDGEIKEDQIITMGGVTKEIQVQIALGEQAGDIKK